MGSRVIQRIVIPSSQRFAAVVFDVFPNPEHRLNDVASFSAVRCGSNGGSNRRLHRRHMVVKRNDKGRGLSPGGLAAGDPPGGSTRRRCPAAPWDFVQNKSVAPAGSQACHRSVGGTRGKLRVDASYLLGS
jgi:hypothetical protein